MSVRWIVFVALKISDAFSCNVLCATLSPRAYAVLYGFTISYVAAPLVGMPFSSSDIVQLVSAVPESIKVAGKLILAAPFAFHSLNGLRHLGWDMGYCKSS